MLASPQPHPVHAPPSSFSFINSNHSHLSLKSSRSRNHSLTLSNTMGWLSRHSTQSSASSFYKGSKSSSSPEPDKKPSRSIELVHNARSGPLGQGATVVRTPEEALLDSGLRSPIERKPSIRPSLSSIRRSPSRSSTSASKPTESPPLPSLPIDCRDSTVVDDDYQSIWSTAPSSRTNPTPSPPSLRSSLKAKSQSSIDVSHVPALPPLLAQSPSQPPFEPVLMSNVPSGEVDISNVLVTLETCTSTYKTTMRTLTSRPSQLSTYLLSLLPRSRRGSDTSSSIYSTDSDDRSAYLNHLTSQGLVSQTPSNIHIFLDRPSAPYSHILNYLRSPVGTADAPETLPRGVQLYPASSQTRLEAILELRDEAAYLELDDLYKLCTDEIRQRQPVLQPRLPRTHSRGQSTNSASNSLDSQHSSLSSLHTLLDRSAHQQRVRAKEPNVSSDYEPTEASSDCTSDSKQAPTSKRLQSPVTPESWKHGRNSGSSASSRSHRRKDLTQSPPAGWI
ncbi:hypothetical protein GYMLUDRAFT_54767 [Collybiopsis luxurians FD-317 M1]|nr:hypothetical protein GYMLUDRAFT_54767 [Collybiopsis luxurians FD-317 M1]